MESVRCGKCQKLLFKMEGIGSKIEIVCPRCGGRMIVAPQIVVQVDDGGRAVDRDGRTPRNPKVGPSETK